MNESNSENYFGLAEVYRKNKQLDSAEVYIKNAKDVKRPILAKGYSSLAAMARERKDLKIVLKYYELAHKEAPDQPCIYYQICTVYDQTANNTIKKLNFYENFIRLYGTEQPCLYEMVDQRISELKEQIHFKAE